MTRLDALLGRMEKIMQRIERLDDATAAMVLELVDGFDELHRSALQRLGEKLGPDQIERLRAEDPSLAWLFDVYAVGVDEQARADAALDAARDYIHSHGGRVEVVAARAGVVRVRLSGSCSGCTASAITLRHGVEEALREGLPGFVALEVEDDDAPVHPPPGPTLLQIENRLPG